LDLHANHQGLDCLKGRALNHLSEEPLDSQWHQGHALVGFVRMSLRENGHHQGCALIQRMGGELPFGYKINWWSTCAQHSVY